MPKDHLERKLYRKSPGRQYGYEYDPLRSRAGESQSGSSESWSDRDGTASQSGALMAHRPDPRRTRQLLRQSIIASKARPEEQDLSEAYPEDAERSRYLPHYEDPLADQVQAPEYMPERRYTSHRGSIDEPRLPSTRRSMKVSEDEEVSAWRTLRDDDPDLDDADFADPDPLDLRLGYAPEPLPLLRSRASERAQRSRQLAEDFADPDDFEYQDEPPPVGRLTRKRKKMSRRGLLLGAGAVVVGGAGIAAYELAPKLPKTISDVGSNIEHQVNDAFKRGLDQGAEQARKELVTALDNLEGFSLNGAIEAARLTRTAYDVFVSPVIKFGATVTGDVLSGLLKAFQTGRHWLVNIGQDNVTLEAIEKVLGSWVDQAATMPKQLDAITQTDLDGAQAYLRALHNKIEDEKARLNNPGPTPAPKVKPTAQATPPSSQK